MLRERSSNRSRSPVSRLFVRFTLPSFCDVSVQIPGTACDEPGCGRVMYMNNEGEVMVTSIFKRNNRNVSVVSRWLV